MSSDQALPAQVRIASDPRGKRTTYEEIEIGKDLGSAELFVKQEHVDQICDRLEDHHPYYELNSPFGGTVVPVYLTNKLPRSLFSQTYSVRGLFYKWSFELKRPLLTNTRYLVTARISEKWIKNDREFVAYEAECRDSNGTLMFSTRRAHALDYIKRTAPKVGIGADSSDERTKNGKEARELYWDPDWNSNETAAGTGNIQVDPLASRDTAVLGARLPAFARHFSQKEFDKRWGWINRRQGANRTVHFDAASAQLEGLPKAFAGAPDVMALIFKSALHFFGETWVRSGAASLTAARPTFMGDYVSSKGYVKEIIDLGDGTRRVVCEVWVEDQRGEKKIVGSISGLVKA